LGLTVDSGNARASFLY